MTPRQKLRLLYWHLEWVVYAPAALVACLLIATLAILTGRPAPVPFIVNLRRYVSWPIRHWREYREWRATIKALEAHQAQINREMAEYHRRQ